MGPQGPEDCDEAWQGPFPTRHQPDWCFQWTFSQEAIQKAARAAHWAHLLTAVASTIRCPFDFLDVALDRDEVRTTNARGASR
eukprot:s713_g10.t1